MTKDKAIAELVRIWHSPHLDLMLKARLTEVIETLKEKNQSDSLVTDSSDACKENKSKLDLVRRQAVLDALEESGYCYHFWIDIENVINSLPSAEPPYQYSEAYVNQLRGERDILQDMVNNMAEPKTGEWIPVSDIRKLEDIVYMHIDSLEGTRNIVEAGMLSAWKEVAEYVDGMLGEDGEE